jgi:hypothetical protein
MIRMWGRPSWQDAFESFAEEMPALEPRSGQLVAQFTF